MFKDIHFVIEATFFFLEKERHMQYICTLFCKKIK
jgi:hypothetical protein